MPVWLTNNRSSCRTETSAAFARTSRGNGLASCLSIIATAEMTVRLLVPTRSGREMRCLLSPRRTAVCRYQSLTRAAKRLTVIAADDLVHHVQRGNAAAACQTAAVDFEQCSRGDDLGKGFGEGRHVLPVDRAPEPLQQSRFGKNKRSPGNTAHRASRSHLLAQPSKGLCVRKRSRISSGKDEDRIVSRPVLDREVRRSR